MRPEKIDHMFAFVLCMGTVDKFLRDECKGEMGQVVAEDIPEMRATLRNSVNLLRARRLQLPMVTYKRTSPERESEEDIWVERIVDEVHFLERHGAPCLQIADACAYGFRRYLTGQKYGDLYGAAILGEDYEMPRHDWNMLAMTFSHRDHGPLDLPEQSS